MSEIRKPGYYWVKYAETAQWEIAKYILSDYFQQHCWMRIDDEMTYFDHEFSEIDPIQITREEPKIKKPRKKSDNYHPGSVDI